RFSHLAIYCAVRCLKVGRRELWQQFNNGDNLLFREADFRSPGESSLFRELWKLPDADARTLAGRLALACQAPLETSPLLDEILVWDTGKVVPLSVPQESAVRSLLASKPKPTSPAKAVAMAVAALPAVEPKQSTIKTQATSDEGTLPASAFEEVVTPPRRVLSSLLHAVVAPVRAVDQFLLAAVGQDNTILHNFLRATTVVSLIVAAAILGWQTSPSPPLKLRPVEPQIVETGKPLKVVAALETTRRWKEKLHFSLGPQAPFGASIDPETGSLTWIPKPDQAPGQYDIVVLVKTIDGRHDEMSIRVTVPPVPLKFNPIAPQTVQAGKSLRMAISVENAEVWRGRLRYGFAGRGPPGATIDPQTGEFSWMPAEDQDSESRDVAVVVTTLNGQSARGVFTIWVTGPPIGRQIRTFQGHTEYITSVAFSPDGRHVLTGSHDHTAILWDAASGQKLHVFTGHSEHVCSVAFSPDGRQILTGSSDKTAILWDASTGRQLQTFHHFIVQSVAFSPNGRQVLTGAFDPAAILWDAVSGEKIEKFAGSFSTESVAFSPDGRQMLTGGRSVGQRADSIQDSAILWDISTGQQIRAFQGHTDTVKSVVFSPDGRRVLTGAYDGTAILWDAANGQKLHTFQGQPLQGFGRLRDAVAVAFSPNGRRILTAGSSDDGAILWDAASGQYLYTFHGHNRVNSVAFSPDGRQILMGLDDNTATLWNAGTSGSAGVVPRPVPPAEKSSAPVASTAPKTPRLRPIPPQTIEAGKRLTVDVSVEDAQSWEGKLRFGLAPNAPAGATIDPWSGQFTWTPTENQAPGTYDIVVSVESLEGRIARTNFTVTTVAPKPVPWGDREITLNLGGGIKLELILISAGSFVMADENSVRIRDVTITQPFYLGKYHVTQEQWQTIMGNNPSHSQGPKNPVESVSWDDCAVFVNKLNGKFGIEREGFRLPTEAEWEYACRAGTVPDKHRERDIYDFGWVGNNSAVTTHPVGKKKPNEWGLYEMRGNVRQWCADWYQIRFDDKSTAIDPTGPSFGSNRVCRGCSWDNFAGQWEIGRRYGIAPSAVVNTIGLRVACGVHPAFRDSLKIERQRTEEKEASDNSTENDDPSKADSPNNDSYYAIAVVDKNGHELVWSKVGHGKQKEADKQLKAKLQELKRQSSDASVKWPRKVDEYVKLGQRQRQMRAARGFGRARPPTPEEQELTEQISALQKEVRELERQKDAILVPKRSMTHSRETAEKRIAQWTKEAKQPTRSRRR
ncbi:MAG: SUMF1/EgtB/PvdO family nonheme iron enzyme, partial [Thermoguttaceae bacterium]